MVVNGRPLKRAKKRVTADLHDILSFPGAARDAFDGPFRANVRAFLSRYGRLPPPSTVLSPAAAPHLLAWRVSFRIGGLKSPKDLSDDLDHKGEDDSPSAPVVDLDIVEEDVSRSRSVYCDQCRVIGWSGHPVCSKRYHFIIRNDPASVSHPDRACMRCGSKLQFLDTASHHGRCSTCNYEMTADDLEDWAYLQLGDTTHLLHGVVHSNGYGHLLRISGREGGSRVLTGANVMGFWDRLCTMLRVRRVTVMDKSKKYGLEYRLLHAVIAGHSWYGNWGYVFGSGSFGLTAESYKEAAQTLANLPLSVFFSHTRSSRTPLQDTISFYSSLSDCTSQPQTVGELFSFIIRLLRSPASPLPRGVLTAWTRDDVGKLEESMIKVLRVAAMTSPWVSWRTLKRAVSRCTSSSSSSSSLLVDYCLKGIAGKSSGDDGGTVAARFNEETRSIEFSLQPAGFSYSSSNLPTESQILTDLRFLYEALLNPSTMQQYRPRPLMQQAQQAAMRLLDCKQFIKDYDEVYQRPKPGPFVVRLWCLAELDSVSPPEELLLLPAAATVGDLKAEATRAFRETYLAFQRFQVDQLTEFGHVADRTPLKLLVGSEGTVKIKGRWSGDLHRLGQFKMERGTENWTVDCSCGARDDDGERMMACDGCGVWQHTRCSGIDDVMEVPSKFICGRCIGPKRTNGPSGPSGPNGPSKKCKYPREDSGPVSRCSANAAAASPLLDASGLGCLTQVQ